MNQKTVKLLKKYADLKGIDKKQIKREWLSLNEMEKDKKRQEIVSVLVKVETLLQQRRIMKQEDSMH